jgi:hypothetical protein
VIPLFSYLDEVMFLIHPCFVCVCVRTCKHICMQVIRCVCTQVCVFACMCLHAHVSMFACRIKAGFKLALRYFRISKSFLNGMDIGIYMVKIKDNPTVPSKNFLGGPL